MRTGLVSLLLLVVSVSAFAASDYVREKNWADEITPGIVVGDPVYLEQKNRHKFLGIYTEAANARMGLVVVHGGGIHPDWGMVGTLRQRLPDHGYATLSIQMPVLAADANPEAYAAHFPEAVERLQRAVAYLKGKGHKRIALVSHSMGSRMSHAYMTRNPAEVSAWAALSMPAPFGKPDGAIVSVGLSLLTGQELRFVPDAKLVAADIARIAVRLIHALIDSERLTAPHTFLGPDRETLLVTPSLQGTQLDVTIQR